MKHCQIADESFVLIEDLDEFQKWYLRAQSTNQLKSFLSIGFIKDSNESKLLNKKNTAANLFRVNLKIHTIKLKNLHLLISKKVVDPFNYLSTCVSIKKKLFGRVFHRSDDEILVKVNETDFKLKVENACPQDDLNQIELKIDKLNISDDFFSKNNLVYLIFSETKIVFTSESQSILKENLKSFKFRGYSNQMHQLEKLIMNPLNESLNHSLPRNILLTGSSGTGKTLAIHTILQQIRGVMNFCVFNSSILLSKSVEFEKIRQALSNLVQLRPSILFLDNLEDVCNEKNQNEKRIVSWLKVLLESLPKHEHVIVVGATNRPEMMDSSLRRTGRFDIEISFPIPTPFDRRLMMKEFLSQTFHSLSEEDIDTLAESSHGFTGADLKHLCELSVFECVDDKPFCLTYTTLCQTLYKVKPTVMREISLEKPNVFWSDIGGLYELRHLLQECVVWPIKHPDAFLRLAIEPPKGILMYGPPGCCKTVVGKALATESGLNFFSIKGPELFSKWVGESERAIREMFHKARTAAPSILFFDEIDALASERGQTQSAVGDRVLAQLLTEIDGIEKLSQVVIIAATNRPDIVDKALLRPGRLDSMVYVPLPDLNTRKDIFRIRTKNMPLESNQEVDLLIDQLANMSEGYTGAEVSAVCQRAGLIALSEDLSATLVTKSHFCEAFKRIKPRISPEMIAFYEKFAASCDELKYAR